MVKTLQSLGYKVCSVALSTFFAFGVFIIVMSTSNITLQTARCCDDIKDWYIEATQYPPGNRTRLKLNYVWCKAVKISNDAYSYVHHSSLQSFPEERRKKRKRRKRKEKKGKERKGKEGSFAT